MKNLVLVSLLAFSGMAFASDSTWDLCEGTVNMAGRQEPLVVSTYEHRASLDGRTTDFTVIFGGYTLTGALDTTNFTSGKVIFNGAGSNGVFEGTVKKEWKPNMVTLSGILNLSGEKIILNDSLLCKTLRD